MDSLGDNNLSETVAFNELHIDRSIRFYLYILRYFLIIAIVLGLVINSLCFLALIRLRFRYKCFPYLCGLIAGNLCFLFFLAVDNFVANVETFRELFRQRRVLCQIEMYVVAVCRHMHHLFIAAACIDHYFCLFPINGKYKNES